MRLQKYLAVCGIASRRKSEELIKDGKISVNGKVITEMGYKIDPDKDKVTVNGRRVEYHEKLIYILLHKPTGYITTVSEQFNRRKVTDLIQLPYRLYPVGRLDYNTSGLLIMTNDGDLAYRLTHPKFKVEKVYIAKLKGKPTEEKVKKFETGLQIEDYVTQAAQFKVLKELKRETIVEITIREGRNRQIRKMCQAIGHPVIELKRIAVGKIGLGNLKVGKWRYLDEEEIQYLKNL